MSFRNFFFTVSGLCAAAAGYLVLSKRAQPLQEMAHQLEEAWGDHHTVV
jgi:hypothetical protein